jgi:hypothetical protein
MLKNSTFSSILATLTIPENATPEVIQQVKDERFVSVVRALLAETDIRFEYTTLAHYGKFSVSTAASNIEGYSDQAEGFDCMTQQQKQEWFDSFRKDNQDLYTCFSCVVIRVKNATTPIVVDGYKLAVQPWKGGYNLVFDPVVAVQVPSELLAF